MHASDRRIPLLCFAYFSISTAHAPAHCAFLNTDLLLSGWPHLFLSIPIFSWEWSRFSDTNYRLVRRLLHFLGSALVWASAVSMFGNLWRWLASDTKTFLLFQVFRDEFQYTLFLGIRLRYRLGLKHGPECVPDTGYRIPDMHSQLRFLYRHNLCRPTQTLVMVDTCRRWVGLDSGLGSWV